MIGGDCVTAAKKLRGRDSIKYATYMNFACFQGVQEFSLMSNHMV